MKKHYLLLIFLCMARIAQSQLSVSATATNGNVCLGNSTSLTATATPVGYTISAIPTNLAAAPGTDILAENGSAVVLPSAGINMDDARWDNINLPFTFLFYGNIFNTISISTNGWIGFGGFSTTTGFNGTIPNAAAPNNQVHGVTSDLNFGGAGSTAILEYFQDGFPPNRRFIVSYENAKFLSGGGITTVQIILYETTNNIEIHTSACTNTTVFKTQGLENSTGTVGTASPGRNYIANWGAISNSYRFSPDVITYSWSPGATLNTTTGSTVTATPVSNTIYTVTALNTANSQTASNTVTVNINASSYTLAAVAGGPQVCQNISVSPGGTYYREGTCKLIASLAPAGVNPLSNSVNTCARIDTGANKKGTTVLYAARCFDIEPILNPSTSTANITLYYLQSEFTDFNRKSMDSGHYDLPTGSADASGISRIRLHQFHGTGTNPTNYTGTQEIFSTATPGFTVIWNAANAWWEVTVPVTGFSGFYLTSEKLPVMPVKLEYFNGWQNGEKHMLSWKATCIATNAAFSIERSADGISFSSIGSRNASQQECGQPFDFMDEHTLIGKNYYRIRMTDADGNSKYSNIVLLIRKPGSFELVSLNPNTVSDGKTVLKVNALRKTDMSIMIIDNAGRKLQVKIIKLIPGNNAITINISDLPSGGYILTAFAKGEEPQTLKFIKH